MDPYPSRIPAPAGIQTTVIIAEPAWHDLAELDLVVVRGRIEKDRTRVQHDGREEFLLAAEDDDLRPARPRDVN